MQVFSSQHNNCNIYATSKKETDQIAQQQETHSSWTDISIRIDHAAQFSDPIR